MHPLLPQLLTVDTSAFTEGIQTLMDNIFPMVGLALGILAPIAAIGIGFGWAPKIINMLKSAIGGGGR